MSRVRGGDTRAFEEIYHREAERIFAYLWRLTGDEPAAADLRQEAFLRLWKSRESWRDGGSVAAYLIRIGRNLAFNAQRHRKVQLRWEAAERSGPAPTSPSPEALRSRQALRDRVNEAIAALPERPREIFSLKRDASLSYREIAELLGISPKTVDVHMTRALRLLREALSEIHAQRDE